MQDSATVLLGKGTVLHYDRFTHQFFFGTSIKRQNISAIFILMVQGRCKGRFALSCIFFNDIGLNIMILATFTLIKQHKAIDHNFVSTKANKSQIETPVACCNQRNAAYLSFHDALFCQRQKCMKMLFWISTLFKFLIKSTKAQKIQAYVQIISFKIHLKCFTRKKKNGKKLKGGQSTLHLVGCTPTVQKSLPAIN